MQTTLVIFSGLPGTGKTTLARRLATELKVPLLCIDDVTGFIPPPLRTYDLAFWDNMISVLLHLTEVQLELGVSVIVDSVFMAFDRQHAQALARKYQALFRPVYTFVSDEALWEQRVTRRFIEAGRRNEVATWERIQHQRLHFQQWEQDTALFVDALKPLEQNYAEVLRYTTNQDIDIRPLPALPLTEGKYHA
jgi:predicted kinase